MLSPCPLTPSDRKPAPIDLRVPEPLLDYLGGGLASFAWKARGPLDEVRTLRDHAGITCRLFRIKAGTAMPHHCHKSSGLSLMLTSGFTDRGNHFLRGEVAITVPLVAGARNQRYQQGLFHAAA